MCRCGFSRRSDDVLCTTLTAPLLAPAPLVFRAAAPVEWAIERPPV